MTVTPSEKEAKIVTASTEGTLKPEDPKALMTEVLRAKLAQMVADQSRIATQNRDEVEIRIAALEEENRALRRAARTGTWDNVRSFLHAASDLIGVTLPDTPCTDLGRRAIPSKRRPNDLEAEVLEGDDLRFCAQPNRPLSAPA
jgi:uncharacterized membrane protein YccC